MMIFSARGILLFLVSLQIIQTAWGLHERASVPIQIKTIQEKSSLNASLIHQREIVGNLRKIRQKLSHHATLSNISKIQKTSELNDEGQGNSTIISELKQGKMRQLDDSLGNVSKKHNYYNNQLKEFQKKQAAIEARNRMALFMGFGFIVVLVLLLVCIYYICIKRRLGPEQELAEEEENDIDNFQYWEEYINSIVENPKENPQTMVPVNQDEFASPGRSGPELEMKESAKDSPKDESTVLESNNRYKKVHEDSKLEESKLEESAVDGDESIAQQPDQPAS